MFALSCFDKILVGHPEHAKTLTMFFTKMFVVHLVRPAYGTEVDVIGLAQPLEPLMDKNVVHKKVGKPVNRNTQSDKHQES